MNKVGKELVTSVIILLFLFVPISDSYAISDVTVTKISGNDNFNNFLKKSDNLSVEVLAKLDSNNTITPDMLIFDKQVKFNSCNLIGDQYLCKLEIKGNLWESKQWNFVVDLYDEGRIVATTSTSAIVDSIRPNLTFKSVNQNKNNLTIDFIATDNACENCNDICSGLYSISFYIDEYLIGEEIIENPNNCKIEKKVNYEIQSEGEYRVKAIVKDYLLQTSEIFSNKIDLDISSPEIKSCELIIKNETLKYISTTYPKEHRNATLNFIVKEKNLTKVISDISPLDNRKSQVEMLSNIKCNKLSGTDEYNCTIPNINVLINNSPIIVPVILVDSVNHISETKCTLTPIIDNNSPQKVYFGTDKIYENISYIKNGINNISIILNEQESGIKKNNVYFNFQNLGIANYYYPDECLQYENYICYKILDLDLNLNAFDEVQISVVSSQDNAGNYFEASTNLVFNNIAPNVLDRRLIAASGAPFFETNDQIVFEAIVTDTIPVKIIANLSSIGINNTEESFCRLENSTYLCQFVSPNVFGPYENQDISFHVINLAGNEVVYNYTISVLHPENESYDYWKISNIDLMPITIDRQTARVAPKNIYSKFTLEPVNSNLIGKIEILDIRLVDCIEEETKQIVYGSIPFCVNCHLKKNETYLKSVIVPGDYKKDVYPYTCQVQVITRNGAYRSMPQIINVSIPFSFKDSNIGTIDSNTKQEICSIKSKVESKSTIIKAKKFLDKAQKFCDTLDAISSIMSAIQNVLSFLSPVDKVPQAREQVKKARKGFESIFDGIQNFIGKIQKYCGYLTCREGLLWGNWAKNLDESAKEGNPGLNFLLGKQFSSRDLVSYVPNSLALSIATGCLPGIINNLYKQIEIDCTYAECLYTQIPEGIPASACSAARDYMNCKYTKGQILRSIPFFAAWDSMINSLKETFSDPLAIVSYLYSKMCKGQVENHEKYSMCSLKRLLDLYNAIEKLKNLKNSKPWEQSKDEETSCDRVMKYNLTC